MVILQRLISTPLFTKGVLIYDSNIVCHTLELPWLSNQQNISCIPSGVYDVCLSSSTKFGDCYRLPSVTGRSGILIHRGNTIKDTRGCILVGLDVNSLGVIHSIQAMKRLFDTFPKDFKLNIRNI